MGYFVKNQKIANTVNNCISITLLLFLSFVLGGYVPALGTDENRKSLQEVAGTCYFVWCNIG